MNLEELRFDPAKNPAVLDTATWDRARVMRAVASLDELQVQQLDDAIWTESPVPPQAELVPFPGSAAQVRGQTYCLAQVDDGQQVFLELGSTSTASALGAPLCQTAIAGDRQVRVYDTGTATVDRFCRHINVAKGPKAMGSIARLGVGARMSTAGWAGVYRAMQTYDFAANPIQNSVQRELQLLENVVGGHPPESIYYPGFGNMDSGHTGSTVEGLWLYGVLEALKCDGYPRYGADADHIKVLRGAEGKARAIRAVNAARYYTFYTLDVGDVLDYGALGHGSASGATYLHNKLPDPKEQKLLLSFHGQKRRVAGKEYSLDEDLIGRLVGKYWDALQAAEELVVHIRDMKGSEPFDLELAVDERPPEVETCACITSDEEVLFLVAECYRRGLHMTHLAPNFGVEKGVDYRCPDGLEGFEARVRSQYKIAAEFGIVLDFHSADDLSPRTCRAIGRATGGHNHFKIAPEPQMLFARTVRDLYPGLFREWWDFARSYAEQEAASGSEFAALCLREQRGAASTEPDVDDSIFHNFGFAYVGKRDENGRYLHRETLYSLEPSFYTEYQNRFEKYLGRLASYLYPA
jgi:hypothetical protein